MAARTVEFSARVPEEHYNKFIEIFSDGSDRSRAMYGASTWFIRNALAEFLAKVQDQPKLQEQVRASIVSMVEDNRA